MVGIFDPFRPGDHLVDDGRCDRIDMDTVFATLSNRRRRYVLKYLSTTDGTASLSDLVEQITAWERGADVGAVSSADRTRVKVSLHQCHLPRLVDVSAIVSHPDRGEIGIGEQFDLFAHYLRH